ncbi:MAG: chemotaxis protein CheA [Bacteriovoracaceae bacterium]|nr:chemotaxis protein CheA [Bacteriovoracaceae bacterium]
MNDFTLELIDDYVAECLELVEEIEPKFLVAESLNKEVIDDLFRLFHSVKGTSASLGFQNIAQTAHEVESIISLLQKGEFKDDDKKYRLLFLRAFDFLRNCFIGIQKEHSDKCCVDESELIINEAKILLREEIQTDVDVIDGDVEIEEHVEIQKNVEEEDVGIEIDQEMIDAFLAESQEIFSIIEGNLLALSRDPLNTDVPLKESFRHIHSFKGNCGIFSLNDLESLSHRMENILEAILQGKIKSTVIIYNTIIPMIDVLKKHTLAFAGGKGGHDIQGIELYLQILDELLDENGKGQEGKINEISRELELPKTNGNVDSYSKRQDIRVDVVRLDILNNLVGELVTVKTMINEHFKELKNQHNAEKTYRLFDRIVLDLQDISMTIRMVPIAGLFRRMIRIIHDISLKSGKKINFRFFGEDTEIDKTIVESISNPLVHMIRNAVDHGVESPEMRKEIGKSVAGNITLSARNEASQIWITLTDDGRGLNKEALIDKAVSNGLIEGDGSDLTDDEIFNLIFNSGFSTAKEVTDVSGRGVGMDVVKTNIEKIKGVIDISTKEGKGTSFIIKIPLTLAVIQGMMLEVGKTKYTLPIEVIQESVKVDCSKVTSPMEDQELVNVRGEMLPVLRLARIHNIETNIKNIEDGILIIVESKDKKVALLIDRLIGQYETVIKPLPSYLKNVRGVSGCSILGDGNANLILDVESLIELANEKTFKNCNYSERTKDNQPRIS